MKRFTIIALVVLVAFSCLISCSNESASVESQLVSVSFTASQSRSLQEIKPGFVGVNDDTIEWYYKATKAPGSNFLTGQATDWTIIPANTSTEGSVAGKLNNQIAFSLGKWDFYLQARLKSDHTTVVYEGFKLGVLLSDANGVSNIDIDVSPIIQGQNGFLKLDGVYIKDREGNTVTPNVFKIDESNYSFTTNSDNTISTADIPLEVGSHEIGIGYVADGAVNAAEIKSIQIYSGRTTTVIGFVDEQTGLVEFNPISDSGVATPVFNEDSITTFTINNVSPSMMASTNGTTIYTSASFPSGSLSDVTVDNATLTVNVKSIDSNFSVGAAGDSTPVAGLDISLVVKNQPVTQFNNMNVTITTFIPKGLSDVKVYYAGRTIAENTEGTRIYDPDTGMLSFTTTHFSEFYVGSSSVCINTSKNKAYSNLLSAVNETSKGETIMLIADCITPALGDWTEYNFEEGCIFDLNGKTLTNNVTVPGTTPAGADSQSVFQGRNITVQNGTINGNGDYSFFIGNGTKYTSFTIKDVKIEGAINCYYSEVVLKEGNNFTAPGKYYAVYGDTATKIVIEDGKYVGGTNGVSVMQFNYEGNSTIIMGGEIDGYISTFTNEYSNGNAVIKSQSNSYSTSSNSMWVKLGDDEYFTLMEKWDGYAAKSYTTPVDTANKIVTIASAEEFALFGKEISKNPDIYKKQNNDDSCYTIVLADNIDFGGKVWTPIKLTNGDDYNLVLDGNGKTISNLFIYDYYPGKEKKFRTYSGLFETFGGTIKDLTVVDTFIVGERSGVLIGASNKNITIQNVIINNAEIRSEQKNGGLIGFVRGKGNVGSGNCLIDTCNVSNVVFKTYDVSDSDAPWQCGGLFGYGESEKNYSIKNNTVSNISIVNDPCKGYPGISGLQYASNEFIGNIVNIAPALEGETAETVYNKYSIILSNNTVNEGTGFFRLVDPDRVISNTYFGSYFNNSDLLSTKYITKIIIDGNEITVTPQK